MSRITVVGEKDSQTNTLEIPKNVTFYGVHPVANLSLDFNLKRGAGNQGTIVQVGVCLELKSGEFSKWQYVTFGEVNQITLPRDMVVRVIDLLPQEDILRFLEEALCEYVKLHVRAVASEEGGDIDKLELMLFIGTAPLPLVAVVALKDYDDMLYLAELDEEEKTRYTLEDPLWVEAERVRSLTANGNSVVVTYNGHDYSSDVLVGDQDGNPDLRHIEVENEELGWLAISFEPAQVEPFLS